MAIPLTSPAPEAGRTPPARLVQERPAAKNAVALFQGKWACDLRELDPALASGSAPLFRVDRRPVELEAELNKLGRSVAGARILEIGPLEAAHSFQLEQLGAAEILSIESNSDAYLKCLIVKEIAGLKATRFLLGDAQLYVRDTSDRYDLVFCCGVLYHLADPFEFIRHACTLTDYVYVWTHFFDPAVTLLTPDGQRQPVRVDKGALSLTYYQRHYVEIDNDKFLGGNQFLSSWMPLPDLEASFRAAGFTPRIMNVDRAHPNGPAVTMLCIRDKQKAP